MYFCRSMKKSLLGFSVLLIFLLSACKSDFERVRTSGDPEAIYKKALEYYEEENYSKAQAMLELVISSYRGQEEAEDIYFKYAYTYYHLRSYILASYYFNNFAQTYTSSPKREEAEFMSAYSNYQLSPTSRLDQTYTQQAIQEFQLFANTYPNSERVAECNRLISEMRAKLEDKAYHQGKLYYDLRQYQAAMYSYETLLREFPETREADKIRFHILDAAFLLAENSILNKRAERYEEALELSEEYLLRFEDGAYRKETEQIKESSIKELKKLLGNERYQNESAGIGS